MPKARIAPPPFAAIRPATVPPPATRSAAAQKATAVSFAPVKRVAGRRDGEASELVNLPDGSFRLRSLDRGTLTQPNGLYNFVRVHGVTRNEAPLYASAKLPHAALAQNRPVIYAGTAKLDGGQLDWWSNYSGTYQPIAEFRAQARLPVDKFTPWQKLQMGGTGMQRGTFTERTAKAAPEPQRRATAPDHTAPAQKPAAATGKPPPVSKTGK